MARLLTFILVNCVDSGAVNFYLHENKVLDDQHLRLSFETPLGPNKGLL